MLTRPRNSKLIYVLGVCGLAAIFSSTLAKTPTLPLFASHLGAGDALVGWIAAASTIPGILMSYLAGACSDRYGRKRILFIALFIFATAPFLYLLVETPLQLAAVRFYHGFATAIFVPVAMAAIASLSDNRKGEMLSFYSSSTLIGRAAAPFAGGILLAVWGFPGVFLTCALTGVMAMVIGSSFWSGAGEDDLPKAGGQEAQPTEKFLGNLRTLLGHRQLLLVGSLEAAVFFSYGAFEVLLPLYARQQSLEIWHIGIIMGLQLAGVIVFKPLFGRLSDQIGRMRVILAGLAVCAVSVGGLTFWSSLAGILTLNIGFGLGFAMVTSSTRPLAAETARKGQIGASLGILSTLMDIGQAAGPPAMGIISALLGYQTAFLVLAMILSAAFLSAAAAKNK